jgi:hypothetical protein
MRDRRVIVVGQLSDEDRQRLADASMDPRHAHLNALMTDRPLIDILNEVAERNGLSLVNMFARSRTAPTVNARHEYFFIAMNETAASSIEIGKACGKDHSAVLYGAIKHAFRNRLPVPRGLSTRCYTRHSSNPAPAGVPAQESLPKGQSTTADTNSDMIKQELKCEHQI